MISGTKIWNVDPNQIVSDPRHWIYLFIRACAEGLADFPESSQLTLLTSSSLVITPPLVLDTCQQENKVRNFNILNVCKPLGPDLPIP